MKHILLGALGLVALTAPAMAGPREDVLYGISRCGGIAEDRSWLDCVYGAAQPMRAHLGLPPAPAAQQRLVPVGIPGMAAPAGPIFQSPQPQQQQTYISPNAGWLERNFAPTPAPKPGPVMALKSYEFDGAGYATITLANGEVWEQDNGDNTKLRLKNPPASYKGQIVPMAGNRTRLRIGNDLILVNKAKP